MYVFYNPNPAGKRIGDCVIRAICKLTGETWDDVYTEIVLQGYVMKDLPSANAVWAAALRRKGFVKKTIPNTCPACYTVRDFCMDNPEGEYILATGSHVIAVVDGKYYDAWDSGEEVPVYFFEREDG